MTNHWNDIGNSSLVFAIGCNPAENHPACMAHVNRARFGDKKAKLVVVDPRKTRTALQADQYVRIRPGTDIAFINGVMREIMFNGATINSSAFTNLRAWHDLTATNSTSLRKFIDNAGAATTEITWPRWADTKFLLGPTTATGQTVRLTGTTAAALGHLNVKPGTVVVKIGATTYTESTNGTNGDYVVNYIAGTIKRTAGSTIALDLPLAGPPFTDVDVTVDYGYAADDYARETITSGSSVYNNMPKLAASIDDANSVYMGLKNHVAKYDTATVSTICGCTEQEIKDVAKHMLDNSRFASSDFGAASATPNDAGYKAGTLLYAMGGTQHTCGSQNVRSYAVLMTFLGNMGRAGGGINALRGIHNVQGSTDMGNLFDGIPAYSGNPKTSQTFGEYMNALFGNRLLAGTGTSTARSAYTPADLGIQQRGFYNMTREWFGSAALSTQTEIDDLWACWPKGDGFNHIDAFRLMGTGSIKACVVVGQNPAVTEPNQTEVRKGLQTLDMLVVQDMFETETAACSRKATGVTYLLPACSHVEEAGSVTNSGRWLQWRERARSPKGNSKADVELLLRFAKALSDASAFSHITAKWAGTALAGADAYATLYGKYGWTPVAGNYTSFEALSESREVWQGKDAAPKTATVKGSEIIAENIYKEMARPLNDNTEGTKGGTIWIYSGNIVGSAAAVGAGWQEKVDHAPAIGSVWQTVNRAKSRDNVNAGPASTYPRWGWAWLLNRRVFYNNGESAKAAPVGGGTAVKWDVDDNFVAPHLVGRLFVINTNLVADFASAYRTFNALKDMPDRGLTAAHVHPGRIPSHVEPYETPHDGTRADKVDLVTTWGQNTKGTGSRDLLPAVSGATATTTGTAAQYKFVLTTIRCVEHFQGGPITRNNPYNVEAEPRPWIEINSQDAAALGIVNGQMIKVTTARGNSSQAPVPPDGAGFVARVGVGLQANQRVGKGVVAIPWHWGEKGLSTGSRANDLTIDAGDANTVIPEYKACLCNIEKM